MYQPISTIDPVNLIFVPALILLFIGTSILGIGIKKKEKSNRISGIICLVLCAVTIFGFGPNSFQQADDRRKAMAENIKTKYNAMYGNPVYLKDVKYYGSSGSKKVTGTLFDLVYADGTTGRAKFAFSNQTGEPKLNCGLTDQDKYCELKHPNDLFKGQ